MLSKNVKTHYIIIKESAKEYKRIALTQAQYDFYKSELELKKYSDFIKITDIDTQEILFEGRASKIESFETIKRDPSLAGTVYICDF
tara:strand:+ start:272 stop:532 length:261 start_codon:yes stop_codon:yes gene_type:complete